MRRTIVNVDTRVCTRPTNSGIKYTLRSKLENVCMIVLKSLELPNVVSSFAQARVNTSFIVNYGGNNYSILISDGNYSNDTLIAAINAAFTNNNLSIVASMNGNKVQLIKNDAFSLNFSSFTEYKTLGQTLGFKNSTYDGSNIYVSESIPQTNIDNYFFVKLEDITNFYNSNNFDTLAKIVNNKEKKNPVIYYDACNIICCEQTFDLRTFGYFFIEITDYLGNALNLGGADFSLTLEVTQNLGKLKPEQIGSILFKENR